MKKLLLFALPILLLGFIGLRPVHQETLASIELKKSRAAGCSPYSGGDIRTAADGKFITICHQARVSELSNRQYSTRLRASELSNRQYSRRALRI
jgi:hypothetical protein